MRESISEKAELWCYVCMYIDVCWPVSQLCFVIITKNVVFRIVCHVCYLAYLVCLWLCFTFNEMSVLLFCDQRCKAFPYEMILIFGCPILELFVAVVL